jgi:mono/diheme cytochrome c family protein
VRNPIATVRSSPYRAASVVVALVVLTAVAVGQGAQQPPTPPGFDYWQPEWMTRHLWGPGRMPKGLETRLLRHKTFVDLGGAKEYEGMRSTVGQSPGVIAAGRRLYAEHCAGCHGANGMGNGDMGKALSPSPALLAYMITRPIAVDEYLVWSISEGGKQFASAMPAFKESLSREEIWQIIAYMRAGFPSDTVAEGRSIIATNCARCHAIGKHDTSHHADAPPFREVVTRYPPDDLAEALAEGIVSGHPDMPVFVFQPAEIEAIVAYLGTLMTAPGKH